MMYSQKWTVLDSGKFSAQKNMELDAQLLERLTVDQAGPILHLYDWEGPSATYGHFIDPFQFLCSHTVASMGLQLARRPTGGGIIFHLTDLAFSILVPASHPGYSVNILDNYAFVNQLVIEAIKRFTHSSVSPHLLSKETKTSAPICQQFCMAKPTKYDVMLEGRKVGGGAQRRTKHGFLHQGTISLALPDVDFLKAVLKPDPTLIPAMQAHSFALLPAHSTPTELNQARQDMRQLLIQIVNNSTS